MRNDSKNILLVLQDTYLLQTYSGFIGKIFAKLYLFLIKFRLKLLILFIKDSGRIYLLVPESIKPKIYEKFWNIKKIIYSEELAKIDVSKYRDQSRVITEKISKRLFKLIKKTPNPFELWWTQTAVKFSYHFFPYYDLIEKLILKYQPSEIYTLGFSKEEKTALFLARKHNIKFKYFRFFDFSWIDNFIQKYLFSRQINNKKTIFLKNSQKKCFIRLKGNKQKAYLLSVDFMRHLKMLVPIYEKFKKKGERIFFVSDVVKLEKYLKNLYQIDEDYFYLAEHLRCSNIVHINQLLKKKYKLIWKDFWKFVKNRKLQGDWRAETKEIVMIMKDYFQVVINDVLPLAEIYLKAMINLIKIVKPRGIICLNDARMLENSFLVVGRTLGIKTMIVYPGMFLSRDKVNRFEATYFAALGNNVRRELLQINYPKQKIKIVGDCQLEQWINNPKFYKDKIFQKLQIKPNKKIVLLISDRINPVLSYEEKKEQFQAVASIVGEIPDVQLVIKPHPTEKRESLIADLASWGINDSVVSDNEKIELYQLLKIATVVIITWSMAGFEAMLLGVPVIVANFSGKDYDFKIPYIKGGGAILVQNKKELYRKIITLIDINNPEREKQLKKALNFCSNYYRLPLGGAADRIYKLMVRGSNCD